MWPPKAALEALELAHPGRSSIVRALCALFANPDIAPPFLYLHDAFCPRRTHVMLADVLRSVNARTAVVDARSCISQRAFFTAVLRQLTSGDLELEKSWIDSVDGFCAGLRDVLGSSSSSERVPRSPSKRNTRAQAKSKSRSPTKKTPTRRRRRAVESDSDSDDAMNVDSDNAIPLGPVVLVIDSAEHLRDHLADLLVPLTRLHELARIDIAVVFVSSNSWIDVQPPFAAAPDPYMIHVPPLDKDSMIATLSLPYAGPPALLSLFRQFIASLYATCSAFIRDPDELAYIAAVTWPPVVARIQEFEDGDAPSDVRLVQGLVPAFHAALDALYTRAVAPEEFTALHLAPFLSSISADRPFSPSKTAPSSPSKRGPVQENLEAQALADDLPRVAQFALVAAYLASFNPPKSDIRLFARSAEERRRRQAKTTKGKRAAVAKIPPRLAGPAPFPLDRLLALMGRLMEDFDAPVDDDEEGMVDLHDIAREQAEMDGGRVQTLGLISELATLRLLHRVGSTDKALEGPPMFKCGVSYAVALALARNLGIPLADYLWEAN